MKKLTSLFLIITLCASAFAGALCINLNNADAHPPTKDIYSGNLMEEVLKYYPSILDVDRFNAFIEEHWDDYLFCCCIGQEGQIHIEAFENAGYDYWGVNNNGWITGYTAPWFDSGYSSEGYIHCDAINNSYSFAIRGGSNISNYTAVYSFGGSNSFVPNIQNFISSPLIWGWSKDVKYPQNNTTLSLNFIKGHKDPYNNIVVNYYGRFYFTLSDQHYITQYTDEEKEGLYTYRVYMVDSQDHDYYLNIGPYDWKRGPSSVPGIEESLPGGIYWFDITDFVNYHNISAVTYSEIPVLPSVFGSNRVDIVRDTQEDTFMQFQDAFNQFLEQAAEIDKPTGLSTHAFQKMPKSAPVYIVPPTMIDGHAYYTGQSMHVYFGALEIYNIIEKYGLNTCIVTYNPWRQTGDSLGFLDQTYEYFQLEINPLNNQNYDMISLPPEDINAEFIFQTYDCIIFCLLSQVDDSHLIHFKDYVLDSPGLHNGMIGDATVQGFYYLTARASDTINYYYLADGFTKIQEHLIDWSNSWNDSVQTFVSGIGALIYQAETLGGKLDSIFNYLQFDLSDKLDEILDKLDNIADNTDEESHGFWVLPLFEFVNRFSPDTSQFSESIDAIDELFESIPSIPAVPTGS